MLKKKMVGNTRQSAARKGTPRKNFTLTATEQELEQLVAGTTDLRVKALVLLLMDSGLRASELVALDRTTINIPSEARGGVAAVGNVRNEKTGQGRAFYVSNRAFEAINLYLNSRDDTNPALFPSVSGGRLAADRVRWLIYAECDRLGIKRFPLHEFRARLALRLGAAGSSICTTAKVLGWSTNRLPIKVLGFPAVEIPPLDLQVN